MTLKTVFTICAALLFIVVLFLIVYNFVFKKDLSDVNLESGSEELQPEASDLTPEATIRSIATLVKENTVGAVLMDEDTIVYVQKDTGHVYKVSVRGSTPELIFKPGVTKVARVEWNDDQTIALYETDSNQYSLVDIAEKKMTPIYGPNDYIVWGEKGKMLTKRFDAETSRRALYSFVPDQPESLREVIELPYRRIGISSVPNSFLAAYWPEPDAGTESVLSVVSFLSPGTPRIIYRGGYGADFKFSPSGENILISSTEKPNSNTMRLGVMDKEGQNFKTINIPTLVSKAAWGKDDVTIYYAFPNDIPPTSIMPNSYINAEFNTTDSFFMLNTQTGKQKRIVPLDQIPSQIDATNLFLSKDEDALYFTNRINGSIHRLNIK